jgi:ribosomal protein S6
MAQEVIYNPGQPINITGVDNNIVFESVRNIIATSFASYLFEDNTNSTVNGAQVVVTLTHVMTDGVEYNASNLQNQSAEGAQLSYLINNKRQAGYTIYDFDVKSGLGERAAEVQAQAIATVSQSITRSLLCEYASLIVSSCLNGATTDVHPNVIVIDNFTDLLNIDEAGAKKNVNILKNTFAGLKQLYNKYELGTAIEDYLLVIGTRGQQALNNALMFSASDKAYEEIGKEGG